MFANVSGKVWLQKPEIIDGVFGMHTGLFDEITRKPDGPGFFKSLNECKFGNFKNNRTTGGPEVSFDH